MARKQFLDHPTASGRPAVIYARVSSRDQEKEGFSIPAQLELLRSYAGANGFTVLKEFIDVEKAKQAGRTGFGEMITLLRRERPTPVVLVEKTDRLYRNLKDWVTVDDLGVEIHFVKEGVVLSPDSRSSEKVIHGMKVLMAKNYIDNLSEETRKGMLEKARQGIWPSYAALGYLNVDGPNGKRTIVPDPGIAPNIRAMYERYATGRYSLKDNHPHGRLGLPEERRLRCHLDRSQNPYQPYLLGRLRLRRRHVPRHLRGDCPARSLGTGPGHPR